MIDTWEGHLTPPEAASIADRASRGCDPNMVRAAAELALSCLPHSHALNPNEIQRAILQCKEQSDDMLECACFTVETAAKGGGVYPEVLFQVAKYWYELYIHHTPGGEQMMDNEPILDVHSPLVALIEPGPEPVIATTSPVVVTTAPAPPYHSISIPYAVGYNFLHYGGPIHPPVPLHQPPPMPMYQFQYPPPAPPQQLQPQYPANQMQPIRYYGTGCGNIRPMYQLPSAPPPGMVPPRPQHRPQQLNQTQLRYLLTAYRVGMLAMETLARRVHDDRPQAKYARNPPYGEDVKWLLRISKHLGIIA